LRLPPDEYLNRAREGTFNLLKNVSKVQEYGGYGPEAKRARKIIPSALKEVNDNLEKYFRYSTRS
jgi:hypothetical protein